MKALVTRIGRVVPVRAMAVMFAAGAIMTLTGCDEGSTNTEDILGYVSAGVSLILTILSFTL